MKKNILICFILVAIFIITFIFVYQNHRGLRYAKKSPYNEIMKYKIEDMGDYYNLDFSVRDFSILFFRSIGTMYIAKYSDDNYKEQKEVIENRNYLNEPISNSKAYIIPKTQTEINNWIIRIEDDEKKNYPHEVNLIGYNDEKKAIVYMSFSDPDLDYIDSLDHFIYEYFNYKF